MEGIAPSILFLGVKMEVVMGKMEVRWKWCDALPSAVAVRKQRTYGDEKSKNGSDGAFGSLFIYIYVTQSHVHIK